MAAATIPVLVKSLVGDTIALDVEPSLGLKGVCDALARFDSAQFPREEIRVFTMGDEEGDEKTVLEPDTLLGVVLCPTRRELLHTQYIEDIREDRLYGSISATIVRDRSFHRLRYLIGETEYDIDVRHPRGDSDGNYGVRFRVTLVGSEVKPFFLNWMTPWEYGGACSAFTSNDCEWILESIQKTLIGTTSAGREFDRTDFALPDTRHVRCECGAVVCYNYLNTHRKSKKHIQSVPANAVPVKDPKFHCECGAIIEQKSAYQHAQSNKHREFLASRADSTKL